MRLPDPRPSCPIKSERSQQRQVGFVLHTQRDHGDADGVRYLAQALEKFLIAFESMRVTV